MSARPVRRLLLVALAALAVHAVLAYQQRALQAAWPGVPVAPSAALAPALALGDAQLFYRSAAFGLQNMGDQGGRVTPLTGYDYRRLDDWLAVLDRLDPEADYLPTLAGFYFGQTRDPADLRRIVAYLLRIGARDPARNWRWLAHAAYLARHRLHDLPLALEIAQHLAGIDDPAVPLWARQLPAFVLAEVGEEEAAGDLLRTILATDPTLSDDDVRFMERYLAGRVSGGLSPALTGSQSRN